ncbi:MAG TPA: LptA/OstA family protein [Candidatus Sulfotelmatobacter sp.]|jgi:lipopolysaccharide export system protein LptA
MPLKIYRLRRLLAATAVLLSVVVVGMYFYARSKATSVLKQIPGKIGYDIKQTANGFQFSKSDGKRTLFTVQASDVKQFKLNGNAELHNVSIVLYGRDSSRFDQIYGDDFAYNEKTGDVTAKGDVQIDLVANPAGLVSPDQSTPKEIKNPIHLKTRDLVFNKNTGNAVTAARVEFRTPQASGWAVGVQYAGKANTLTLSSQIHVVLNSPNAGVINAAVIEADHAVITSDPREVVLDHPRLQRADGTVRSDRAVFYLGQENQVGRVLATGDVTTVTRMQGKAANDSKNNSTIPDFAAQPPASELRSRADQAEFLLEGKQDLLRTATLTGSVHIEQNGPQPMQGDAGRVILDFAGQNQLQKVHALGGVRLTQKTDSETSDKAEAKVAGPRDFELTAPVIDFMVDQGHILKQAETSGAAQITIVEVEPFSSAKLNPAGLGPGTLPASVPRTVVTAGKFRAQFATSDGANHIDHIHGAPNARIVSSSPNQPDRVSTSQAIDATFLAQGGIESVIQTGNVVYSDGQPADKRTQAWANSALYTPGDQILTLAGSPRVSTGGMAITAKVVRMNRATGDALAEGDVKTTYSELKEQPDGALLASSSPIHVTAQSMTARNTAGTAVYSGNARLWQDANIIEAPTIEFDRDRRFVDAQGTATHPVQTILVQTEKAQTEKAQTEKAQTEAEVVKKAPMEKVQSDQPPTEAAKLESSPATGKIFGKKPDKTTPIPKSSPISITAAELTYADSERKIHYEGGVAAKGADFTASAKSADAYLLPRNQTSSPQSFSHPGQLDRMVAEGDVVIQQPTRHANGQRLVYTAADDKFVLTGGPPSIFDAEQGKITGVSLTFFRRDDRVLVEGEASTPVVTQTRVAR